MTLNEEQKKVQKAMESALSGLQEDPWLTQRVLANAKGEKPVKKKLSTALVLCIVLGLAIIGTAYAILSSSQVAEFFGQHWNQELGERLKEGKAAQIGESVTFGDAVFTLDEVVYKDRALYGIGKARPVHENDVIIPMEMAEDPEYLVLNDEAQALVQKAKASGGRMLTVTSMPRKIGVDDGTMLMPGCIGYYDIPGEEGSVTYSFEASDGFAVNEGTSYQIEMEYTVRQIDENGKTVEGTAQAMYLTVSCVPMVMSDPAPGTSGNTVTIENREGYELITPAVYQETGTLPVCQAVETDFTKSVKPELFNQTGIVSGAGTEEIRFADHAILNLSPEGLFYFESTDDNYTEAPSNVIVERAWVRNWSGHRGEFILDRTELTDITLTDAQAKAEKMISRLGIGNNQYVCNEALDMSLERIRTMGAIWEGAVADGSLLVDEGDYQPYDYSSIPASEEGYYLEYSLLGVDTSPAGGRYKAIFYINSRGIVYANIRNPFSQGEIVNTPETLITSDTAISRLAEELGKSLSRYNKEIKSIQRAALTYEAVRADNKAEGMVFTPVWLILYQDETAVQQDYSCYALINAVDGSLIDASFR